MRASRSMPQDNPTEPHKRNLGKDDDEIQPVRVEIQPYRHDSGGGAGAASDVGERAPSEGLKDEDERAIRRLGVVALISEPSEEGRFQLSVSRENRPWTLSTRQRGAELVVEVPLSRELPAEESFKVMFSVMNDESGQEYPSVHGMLIVLEADREMHLAGPVDFAVVGTGEHLIFTVVVSQRRSVTILTASGAAQSAHLESSAIEPDPGTPAPSRQLPAPVRTDGDGSAEIDICDQVLKKLVPWNADESFAQLLLSVTDEKAYRAMVRERIEKLAKTVQSRGHLRGEKITVNDLSPFFSLTREEVSAMSGICLTITKRIIRMVGIVRWPYRKYRQWQRKLKQLVDKHGRTKALLGEQDKDERQNRKALPSDQEKYEAQLDKIKARFVTDMNDLMVNK